MTTAHPTAPKTANHTPGPWTVTVKADRTMMVAAPAGHYVAKVVGSTAMGDMRERFAADARLIAAAPEMLAVLRGLVTLDSAYVTPERTAAIFEAARAAIATATGGGDK